MRNATEIESFSKGLYDYFMGNSFDCKNMDKKEYLRGYLEGKNPPPLRIFDKPLVEGVSYE